MNIQMFGIVGDFGEDKDAAAMLREKQIKPCISQRKKVFIDFDGVTLVTQSFIHALISDVLRVNGEDALDYMEFRNCSEVVRGIISTVVQYSLDSMADESDSLTGKAIEETSDTFESVAQRLECDPDLKKFDAQLRKIAKAKPKAGSHKGK